MRMLFILGSSLALSLALRVVDPPVAEAISAPAAVKSSDVLVVPAPRAKRQRPAAAITADKAGAVIELRKR